MGKIEEKNLKQNQKMKYKKLQNGKKKWNKILVIYIVNLHSHCIQSKHIHCQQLIYAVNFCSKKKESFVAFKNVNIFCSSDSGLLYTKSYTSYIWSKNPPNVCFYF